MNNQELITLGIILGLYFLALWPSGFIVGKLTNRWRLKLDQEGLRQGLDGAGKLIGFLERIIILTLVFYGEIDAIGFLIAAKSLLRFGELKGNQNKLETEYVLVGTLMSITLAMFLGILGSNIYLLFK
ncbi:MAG: hypothetical protein ACI959_000767 [Limisphaerales bacterium]|jgi:hypothetical protein